MTATDDTREQPVVRADVAPSLEALYAAHAAALIRVLRVAGLPDPADAVQEAFVQAVVRWRKVSRYEDPVAWISRVAINRGLNRCRSHRRRGGELVIAWPRIVSNEVALPADRASTTTTP